MFKNKVDLTNAISYLTLPEVIRLMYIYFGERSFKIESGILYFNYSEIDDNLLSSLDLLDLVEVIL